MKPQARNTVARTPDVPTYHAPPTRVLVFISFTMLLAVGVPLLLYALTDPSGRADLLNKLSGLLPTVVGAFWALLAYVKGQQTHETQQQLREDVAEVKEQVNGRMSELIATANNTTNGGESETTHAPRKERA